MEHEPEEGEDDDKNEKKEDVDELDLLRNKIGELGGAGHYFQKNRRLSNGGARDKMKKEEIVEVLRLLSLGEERVNLKEWKFLIFLKRLKRRQTLK